MLVFAAVFLLHGSIFNGTGWNQNARYDAIFACVEPGQPETGTFRIDRFVVDPVRGVNTGDWARHDGHYYSNKAPGSMFVGIPFYAALFHVERAIGLDPDAFGVATFNGWMLNVWVSVFWTALAAAMLHSRLAERDPARAAFVTVAWTFGTLAFPFDTQLWGHTTAAAFLVLGWIFTQRNRLVVAGIWFGLAVLCDFIAAVGVVGVGLAAAIRHRNAFPIVWLTLGAAPLAILLMSYHQLCFGGWLETGFALSNPDLFREAGGVRVVGKFSWDTLCRLLVSLERGVLIYSPILAFAGVGAWHGVRGPDRVRTLAHVSIVVATLALNAAFWGWHGGGSSGPRYLITSLPFWCLLLPSPAAMGATARRVAAGLLAVSCLNMLAISLVDVMALPSTPNVLFGDIWPSLFGGSLHKSAYGVKLFDHERVTIAAEAAFDAVTRWTPLHGGWAALPYAAVLYALVRWATKSPRRVSSAP